MAEQRLIDANEVYDLVERRYRVSSGIEHRCERDLLDLICSAKTVDAVEVVHGQWIPLEYDGYADGNPVWDLWECSECREEHSGDVDTLTPYCPNCGAKMDGGNEDG